MTSQLADASDVKIEDVTTDDNQTWGNSVIVIVIVKITCFSVIVIVIVIDD